MKKVKSIILWILAIFFALSALVYFPSFSSLFAVLFFALVVPIPKWQEILAKFMKGTVKTIVVIVLAILTIFTAPTTDVDDSNPSNINPTVGISSSFATETTTAPISDVIDATVESTAISATEASAETKAPTTEATVSTTEATTTPTTVPATEETISPTTVPETEPPHVHSFRDATCSDPKTCSCGATEGKANGHSWKDATCSAPKTCTTCGQTTGAVIAHSFSGGKCSSCGAKDPNYVQEPMVWIPASGSKYHSYAGCSGMKNPTQVTKSTAEARNYTPCSKCH